MSAQKGRYVRDEAGAGRASDAVLLGMGYVAREKVNKGGTPPLPPGGALRVIVDYKRFWGCLFLIALAAMAAQTFNGNQRRPGRGQQ